MKMVYYCANALEAWRRNEIYMQTMLVDSSSSFTREKIKSAYFPTISLLDSEFEQKHILKSMFWERQYFFQW